MEANGPKSLSDRYFRALTLSWPLSSQCVARKDFPAGVGGSDICHFCSKRVYVMERLSAEGYFFHRECFRCDVCSCTLRLGGHTFDSQEGTLELLGGQSSWNHMQLFLLRRWNVKDVPGCVCNVHFFTCFTAKFYCKLHYSQRLCSSSQGRFRRRMVSSFTLENSVFSTLCCVTEVCVVFHGGLFVHLVFAGRPKPRRALVPGQQELHHPYGHHPDPTPRYPGFLA